MAHPERRGDRNEILHSLLEKAGIQGFLTTDDLMEAYPEAHQDSERLTVLMLSLRRRGVDVVDSEVENEPEPSRLVEISNEVEHWQETSSALAEDPIGMYLKEMSKVPLLNVQQEKDLAQRIIRGREAQAALVGTTKLSAQRQTELEAQIREAQEAREHLIKANTRLVVSVAKRYMGRGVPFLDLIQEGNLGLMKAVEKYEVERGFRFSTYATWWIRQGISRAIADQARTIRVPVHMVDRIRQVYKLSRELEQTLGRAATIEELAEALKMPIKKVQWILKVSWLPLSLESPVGDDEDSELGMFIEDDYNPSPAQSTYQNMLKEKLDEVLESLPPREARVLRLRYGLDDGTPYTLEEVGQKFGLTRERIRQIEGKALRQLRHPRQSRELKDYL